MKPELPTRSGELSIGEVDCHVLEPAATFVRFLPPNPTEARAQIEPAGRYRRCQLPPKVVEASQHLLSTIGVDQIAHGPKLPLVSAIKMPGAELEEQGNGMVNAKTAVELAAAINVRRKTVGQVIPHWTCEPGD